MMCQTTMANTQINDEGLVDIRPCLIQVVEVMEMLYGESIRCPSWRNLGPWPEDDDKRVGEDLGDLEYSPQKALLIDQTRVVWNQVVRRKMPAVWFIRTHRPVTVIMSAVCHLTDVPIAHVLNGELTDREFESLTMEIGRLAGSPLKICDASLRDTIQKAMPALISSRSVSLLICDWVLEGDELTVVQRLAREHEIAFVCPQ